MPDIMAVDDNNNPMFQQTQMPIGVQAAATGGIMAPIGRLMEYGGGKGPLGMMSFRKAAWQAGRNVRGSNTILGGGYGEVGEVNKLKNVFDAQKYNPRRAMRYRSAEEMIEKRGSHVASALEKGASKEGIIGQVSRRVGGVQEVDGQMVSRFHEGLIGGQMYPRLQAAGRLTRSSEFTAETAGHVGQFIDRANPQLAEALRTKTTIPNPMHGGEPTMDIGVGAPVFESGDEAAMALRMSGRSAMAQSIGGYASVGKEMPERLAEVAGERFLAKRASGELSTAAVKQLGMGVLKKGTADVAMEAGEKIAVETGLKAGATMLAERGAVMAANLAEGPVGWAIDVGMLAWTAFDIMKIGGQLVKQAIINPAVKAVKEGYRSFVGQAYKSPFGMGYVDNEVAATSRARGVQAIQNSRLNARSLLGSEGSMMYAHFG